MKLELLNSEGPILTILKINEDNTLFKLIDQNKKEYVVSNNYILDFISGKINITDSNNKTWNYPSESNGMKQSNFIINEFLKTVE